MMKASSWRGAHHTSLTPHRSQALSSSPPRTKTTDEEELFVLKMQKENAGSGRRSCSSTRPKKSSFEPVESDQFQIGPRIHLQSGCKTVEDAKRVNTADYEFGCDKTYYKNAETKTTVKLKNADRLNCSNLDMDKVNAMHLGVSPEQYKINRAAIDEREARVKRLSSGRGNLADLQAKMNALNFEI